MAKKLRKRPASPIILMVKLLIPWVVMAGVAASLTGRYSEVVVYSCALAGALLATVAIYIVTNRRRMALLLRQG